MLEIILGEFVTVLALFFKKIFPEGQYEKKVRESLIILMTFGITMVVVCAYYLFSYKQLIPPEFLETIYKTLTIAIGSYELVYKQLVRPVLIDIGILTENDK